jgi:RND family efflux transporter MFP subunit
MKWFSHLASFSLLGLAGALTGCSADAKSTDKKAPHRPAPVKVARVTATVMERIITVSGSLTAQDVSPLSVKVPGRMMSIEVDLGSVVKRGQVIAQVDRRDYELRIKQAEAMLAQARALLGLPLEGNDDLIDLEQTSRVKQARAVRNEAEKNKERIRKLSEQKVLSESELEVATVNYEVALNQFQNALEEVRNRQAILKQRRAEYDLARQQLEDTTIRAPFDGAVQERRANLGEYLPEGTPVVTLVRIDPIRLRVEVSERDAHRIRADQKVRVFVEGDTNIYRGQITRLSPAITEQNRMLVVEADVPSGGVLRPGSFARAEIVTAGDSPALTVPPAAIVTFAGIEKVFVVEDGKAVEKFITTGDRTQDRVEIVAGLKEGERVVLNPGGLQTGQPVTTRDS